MDNKRNLNIIIDAKDNASKVIGGISSSLERQQNAFKSLAIGGTVALAGIGLLMKKSLTYAGELEQQTVAFTTMLGSATEAQKLLTELTSFAQKTPFELQGIRQTAKQLLAFGIESDNLIPTLKMLGDVASGVSVPIEQVAYAYGQVRTANQLYGTELRQFMNAGIPILTELAKMFGVTEVEAKKMVEQGKVGFKDVEEAFRRMSGEGGQFFNLMDAQSKTFNGTLSNLKDSIGKAFEGIGTALLPQFKELAITILDIVTKVQLWVEKNPELAATILKVALAMTLLATSIGIVGVAITGLAITAGTLGIGLGVLAGTIGAVMLAFGALVAFGITVSQNWDMIKEGAQVLGTYFDILGIKIKNVFMTVWAFIKPIFDGFINYFNDMVDGIEYVIEKLEKLVNAVKSFGKNVKGGASMVGDMFSSKRSVNDAIITNKGEVITTHPDDHIIATKNPNKLLGQGGGSVVLNIDLRNSSLLSQEAGEQISQVLMKKLQLQMRGVQGF